MAGTPLLSQRALTRKQAILIGSLSCALFWTIWQSQGNNSHSSGSSSGDEVPADGVASGRRNRSSSAPTTPTIKWPQFSLDVVSINDPFVPLETLKQPDPKSATNKSESVDASAIAPTETDRVDDIRRQKALAFIDDLRRERVSLILHSGSKASAVIGTRVVKEGQVLDGVRIVSIHSDKIVVEAAP